MSLAFWDSVNAEIKRKNTTQEWVAQHAGIKYQTFRGWISKGILPRVDEAVRIARELNVTVDYLIDGSDEGGRYAEKHLLLLARKYTDVLENLETLDPLTLSTVKVQIEAVSKQANSAADGTMVAEQIAGDYKG